GGVYCWGAGTAGQLNSSLPNQVLTASGPLANVTQVSIDYGVACAVTTAGEVWCWGTNTGGQGGNGGDYLLVATIVGGLPATAKQVGVGSANYALPSAAVMTDGSV